MSRRRPSAALVPVCTLSLFYFVSGHTGGQIAVLPSGNVGGFLMSIAGAMRAATNERDGGRGMTQKHEQASVSASGQLASVYVAYELRQRTAEDTVLAATGDAKGGALTAAHQQPGTIGLRPNDGLSVIMGRPVGCRPDRLGVANVPCNILTANIGARRATFQ